MLELSNIVKIYPAGSGEVTALSGVSLAFRESEFVSILGPSGCGKTTMLNIVGGLDQYTTGDLRINGRSTKGFSSRDWDAYRNHSIGFVFQSYNLIPHQTILRNVELALTLAGVGKSERRRRAEEALASVGLGDQLHKKPNQLSGGQMQRVAIARALVNDPDILLADEPTGALDSETSVQVMDLMREIAQKRLVIMVTHNPELAERYSTRLIRMLDGRIVSDSAPLSEDEIASAKQTDEKRLAKTSGKRIRKPSMSFRTAFMLSLRNLFTKKGRTILTAFAGSIGILGISLILSVSTGMTSYINTVQESALSAYPISIEKTTVDMSAMLTSFAGSAEGKANHDRDAVYKSSALYSLISAMSNMEARENDLRSFKAYLESRLTDPEGELAKAVTGIQYAYDLDDFFYAQNPAGEIVQSSAEKAMTMLMGRVMTGSAISGMMSNSSLSANSSATTLWQEILPSADGSPVHELLSKQYDLVYGDWPSSYDEVVLVLSKNNELTDLTLYALGLETDESVKSLQDALLTGTAPRSGDQSWSYEELCRHEFRVILPSESYRLDEATGLYTDLRASESGLRYLYDQALPLRIVGIIRPAEGATAAMLNGSVAYTRLLTEYVLERSTDSPAISAQKKTPGTDVLTGLPFRSESDEMSDEAKAEAFLAYYAGLSDTDRRAVGRKILTAPTEKQAENLLKTAMRGYSRESMEQTIGEGMKAQTGMDDQTIKSYLSAMSDEQLSEMFTSAMKENLLAQYTAQAEARLQNLSASDLDSRIESALSKATAAQLAADYDAYADFSESTCAENLVKLGELDVDSPSSVSIYVATFADKDKITAAIDDYNETVGELQKIRYTDYIGILLSSITTIIDAITYVLLAFVAISLIVSSIMIGVITLISVQERTKEIGILRAIGASKRDVSSMFNAETVIIGFVAGLIGVLGTVVLCVPINLILYSLTGLPDLRAFLPIQPAIILVLVSVFLSLLAGIIPSRSAARKNPVVALRTE